MYSIPHSKASHLSFATFENVRLLSKGFQLAQTTSNWSCGQCSKLPAQKPD
jgi:hypothetical protein